MRFAGVPATTSPTAADEAAATPAGAVLVLAPDPHVRGAVREACDEAGIATIEAADLESARQQLSLSEPDVVVLSISDPVGRGLEVVEVLRSQRPALYVLALTDGAGPQERTQVLHGGVDDVMSMPFSPAELSARVTAGRRSRTSTAGATYRQGDLVLDLVARQATIGARRIDLTRREFSLLRWLATHPRQAFTRDELLSAVWGSSIDWQSATTVTEHVRRLRLLIEVDPSHPARIRTVRGKGYRFDPGAESAPVLPAAEDTADSASDARFVLAGGALVFINRAGLELFGASSDDELVGRALDELVTAESLEASATTLERPDDGRWPRPERLTLRALDGSEVPVEVVRTPATWKAEPASQVLVRALDRGPG